MGSYFKVLVEPNPTVKRIINSINRLRDNSFQKFGSWKDSIHACNLWSLRPLYGQIPPPTRRMRGSVWARMLSRLIVD